MEDASAETTRRFCNRHWTTGIGAPLHRTFRQRSGLGALKWDGQGLEEVGRRSDTGAVVVRIDPRYFRPAEVEALLGDPSRAREKLGWTPARAWKKW